MRLFAYLLVISYIYTFSLLICLLNPCLGNSTIAVNAVLSAFYCSQRLPSRRNSPQRFYFPLKRNRNSHCIYVFNFIKIIKFVTRFSSLAKETKENITGTNSFWTTGYAEFPAHVDSTRELTSTLHCPISINLLPKNLVTKSLSPREDSCTVRWTLFGFMAFMGELKITMTELVIQVF